MSGQELIIFIGEAPLSACTIAPDGYTIVAGDASGRVYFLRLEGVEPLTVEPLTMDSGSPQDSNEHFDGDSEK